MRASGRRIVAGAIVVLAVLAGVSPASAASVASWAAWEPLSGTAGAYTTSVEVAAQPAITADVTSDSRGGQVGVVSGASSWLSEGTPVGAKYGSSRDQPYLNLRPRVDNATSPSVTTYSFADPTPTSGWTFVLGDIDADAVRIQAVAADGHVLDAAELGFRGGFNYCAPGVAGKPSCTGSADDVPSWDPATLTLTGNAAAADTSGSAAWFEPSAPITLLSFVFTRRAGFPVYQTWFASLARDVTGSVTDVVDGAVGGVAVTLTDGNGDVVGTTTTAPDGTYSFPGYVASDGYTVSIAAPEGKIATGPTRLPADLSTQDAVADFTVRDIVPVAVSGQVTDADGNPVAGVSVTIDGQTVTTGADGRYLFDQVSVGTHTASITTPDGYTVVSTPPPFTVPAGSETPITGVDFRIAENPSLSGTVRANGTGVAGVTVTATGPGGTFTAVTGADGTYLFPALDPGAYEVTITTPDGYTAAGPTTREETVADADVEDVDFDLARLGAVTGTVRIDGGDPVADVVIRVDGPDGPLELRSEADGAYSLDRLPPGTYTLTVVPPAGHTVVGAATRTVVITASGELVEGQDFALAAETVTPPPTPTPSGGPGAGDGTGGALPATGLSPATGAWAAAGATVLLAGAALLVATRRRARRDQTPSGD